MKRNGKVPAKATPRVTQKVMGKNTPHLTATIGRSRPRGVNPGFIQVAIEPIDPVKEQKLVGTFFLGVTLGTRGYDGEPGFTELDGCIEPHQLDGLIACLTAASEQGRARGFIPRGTP